MTKKLKIIIAVLITVLLATFFISLAFSINNFVKDLIITLKLPPSGHYLRGKLLATSVSPQRKWKVKIYYIASGAYASDRYYAEVTDLRGKIPKHEIDLHTSTYYDGNFRWKSANTVVIGGQETNVLTGTVLHWTSVSPDGRWKVKVYDRFPIKRRYGYTYAKVIDQTGKKPPRDIILNQDKIDPGYQVRWKNANIINIYGQEVDVTKE